MPDRGETGEQLDIRLRAPRTRVTSLRLRPAEHRAIAEAAREAGLKTSTFIKEAAMAAAARASAARTATQVEIRGGPLQDFVSIGEHAGSETRSGSDVEVYVAGASA